MNNLKEFEKNLEYINERIEDIKANLKKCKDPYVADFFKLNLLDYENMRDDLIFQINKLKERKEND